jgi:hypothetical protein
MFGDVQCFGCLPSLFSYSFLSSTWRIEHLRTGFKTDNVVLIGDFNSYAFEDPVTYLLENGFKSLRNRDESPTPYTYVFDGQWGTLDFAFVMDDTEASDAEAEEWHVNADEIGYLDYNLDFGRDPEIFRASVPARFSDHDPIVIGMTLKEPLKEMLGGKKTTKKSSGKKTSTKKSSGKGTTKKSSRSSSSSRR